MGPGRSSTLNLVPDRSACTLLIEPKRYTMRATIASLLALAACGIPALAEEPKTVTGLKNPESAAVGPGGKVYVTVIGERDKPGDGSIAIVDPSGKITTFATGLDDPKGLVVVGEDLYVADVKKVWKVDAKGKLEVFVAPEAFPRPPVYFNDIAYDGAGNFYVSDSGDRAGKKGAVFRIDAKRKATLVLDAELTSPQIAVPNGLLVDGPDHLLVADFGLGYLYRYDLRTGTAQRIGGGFGGTDGLARQAGGRLFVSDWKNGRLFEVTTDQEPPKLLSDKFQSAADISLTPDGKTLLVPDMKAGTLTWFPIR
jgi:gluconolactonase